MIKTKGQSTLEYATIITIVVASLTVMSTYVQRSIQANLKVIENQINGQPCEPVGSAVAISHGKSTSIGTSIGDAWQGIKEAAQGVIDDVKTSIAGSKKN